MVTRGHEIHPRTLGRDSAHYISWLDTRDDVMGYCQAAPRVDHGHHGARRGKRPRIDGTTLHRVGTPSITRAVKSEQERRQIRIRSFHRRNTATQTVDPYLTE